MGSATVGLGSAANLDRRLMLWLGGAVLVLIALVSVIAPATAVNDPRPSSYNPAPGGAKAAFLTLQSLGWQVDRWDQPIDDLRRLDAAHTTLVMADPSYTALDKDRMSAALKQFLEGGGRVLVTGGQGALLLPGGAVEVSRRLGKLCYTQPEGPGALARAGAVEMADEARWAGEGPEVYVEQRCASDAVVVRRPVGRGEAIWWSSASPLTNAELHNDADLRLLLASLGRGRRVLFDESLQQTVRSPWSAAQGLPLWWMLGQAGVVFALLVFSFSRRRGPIRLPVGVPRSSPVEFAVSMGDLYERAGATGAATEAARRRLERALEREAGLAQRTLQAGPEAVATALETRFGGQWQNLGEHLREAVVARDLNPRPSSALKLVQALGADTERVRRAARPVADGVLEV